MKYIIFVVILFFSINSGHAQAADSDDHYKYAIGGFFNGIISKNNPTNFTNGRSVVFFFNEKNSNFRSITFSPFLLKKVSDKSSIGFRLDWRSDWYEAKDVSLFGNPKPVDVTSTLEEYGAGIYFRHLLNTQGQFSFYVEPGISYLYQKDKSIAESAQTNEILRSRQVHTGNVNIGFGVLTSISKRVRLRLHYGGLNYLVGVAHNVSIDEYRYFQTLKFTANLSSVFLGVEYMF